MQHQGRQESSSKKHPHRSSGIKLTALFSPSLKFVSCQGRTLSPFLKAAVFLQTVYICLPGTTSNTTSPASETTPVCWHITTGHTETDRWTGMMTDCQPLQSAPSCTSKKGRKTIKVWWPLSVGLLIPLKISLADVEGKWRWSTPSRDTEKQECVGTNTKSRQAVISRHWKKTVSAPLFQVPLASYTSRHYGRDVQQTQIRPVLEKYKMMMSHQWGCWIKLPVAEWQPINGIIGRKQAPKVASEGGGAKPLSAWNSQQVCCLYACFLCSPHAKLLNNAAKFAWSPKFIFTAIVLRKIKNINQNPFMVQNPLLQDSKGKSEIVISCLGLMCYSVSD